VDTRKIRDLDERKSPHPPAFGGRPVEGDLRKEIQMNIRRLIEIQAYRGISATAEFAGAGQRTHTNRRTAGSARGPVAAKKKTVGKKG